MKSKWNIIISIFLIGVAVIAIWLINIKYENLSSSNKKIIGETDITKKSYGYPIIKLLSCDANFVKISAGIYRFGDINQDGIVGTKDINTLKIMLDNNNVGFSNGQIKLADVNEDGKIDNEDLKLFREYISINGEIKYDIKTNRLSYCLIDKEDVNACNWQHSNKFKLDEGKNYYAFVKQNDTGRVSDVMRLNKIEYANNEE